MMEGWGDAGALSRAEAASLLGWWLDAGVDVAVQDEARDWRRSAPPAPAPLPEADIPADTPPPSANAAPVERPATLEAFHAWLAESADLPLFRTGAARALPHGPANAELMVIAGIPQPEDSAAGQPIGGEAWVLATRMLAAIGIKPEQAYVAALTCFSGTGSRFSEADSEACRQSMLDQIRLVAPKRLLLLGDAPAKLLLGQPMATARGRIHQLGGIPAVVTFPPRHLLRHSEHKKLAWADLLLLMGDDR